MSNPATTVGTTSRTLVELEAIIDRGLQTFVAVGEALMEIRTWGLYRETHRSFDAYCRERWGWSKTHANRHIQAAEIGAILTPIGVILPNEAVARELAPLLDEPERVREVWVKVQEEHGPAPSAVQVRAVVRGRAVRARPLSRRWDSTETLSQINVFLAELMMYVPKRANRGAIADHLEQWAQRIRTGPTTRSCRSRRCSARPPAPPEPAAE